MQVLLNLSVNVAFSGGNQWGSLDSFKGSGMGIKIEDRIGQKFNRLTVLSVFSKGYKDSSGKQIQARFLCQCECGNIKDIATGQVISGKAKSCGCYQKETHTKHGLASDSMYKTWFSIRDRVLNPLCKDYPRYGGLGIGMEAEWVSDFPAFRLWVSQHLGEKPSPQHSIDRVDNDDGYFKHNLRFATPKEQSRNRRNTLIATFQGVTASLAQHCEAQGANYSVVKERVYGCGWTVEQALSIPTDGKTHSRDEYEEPITEPAEELETA